MHRFLCRCRLLHSFPGRRFAADRSGTAAIMMALISTVLVGFAAITVDGAHFFVAKRRLQTATDMAAMAAASNIANATTTAAAVMAANGFPQTTLRVTPGRYTPDPGVSAPARFVASSDANAVEVVSSTSEPFIFGSAFHALVASAHADERQATIDGLLIQTRAVASRQDVAAFTLGSGLAALDGGVLNAVLGGLLGTRLSFNLLDYQSLASASVDLFSLSDRLAADAQVTGATYGALGANALTQAALLDGLANSLQGDARASAALRWISIAVPPGVSVHLGDFVDFGPAQDVRVGTTHPFSARVAVLDVLAAVAQLGGVNHIVSVDLGSAIPGLQSTTMLLTLGESAGGSRFFTAGPQGTLLHTAQVRLLVKATITGAGLPASLALPLYVEVAPATASLATVACASGAAQANVGLDVTPGLVDAWIGDLAQADFGRLSAPPFVQPASLLAVAGGLSVQAYGHLSPTSQTPVRVPFSTDDIRAATPKTTASTLSLDAVTASLTDNTQVTVKLGSFAASQPQLGAAVTSAIRGSLAPIDAVMNQALSALGVSVGRATTSVPGVRCGQGQLVN